MSWRERAVALAFLLGLTGCGFHPLYGGHQAAAVAPELASISVAPIPERIGQLLAISLRDGFNPAGARVPTRYVLQVTLVVSRAELGIRKDATASRAQLDVLARYTLTDTANNSVPLSGNTHMIAAFDVLDDPYATVVAEQDAQTRVVRDLSEDLRTRIALFMQSRRASRNEPPA